MIKAAQLFARELGSSKRIRRPRHGSDKRRAIKDLTTIRTAAIAHSTWIAAALPRGLSHAAARLREEAAAEADGVGGVVAVEGMYRARIQYTEDANSVEIRRLRCQTLTRCVWRQHIKLRAASASKLCIRRHVAYKVKPTSRLAALAASWRPTECAAPASNAPRRPTLERSHDRDAETSAVPKLTSTRCVRRQHLKLTPTSCEFPPPEYKPQARESRLFRQYKVGSVKTKTL